MDTPGRQQLSGAMMEYLAEFAHKGKPEAHGLPKWKEWSNKEGKDKAIVFDATETEADIYMIDEEITAEAVDAKFWELYFAQPVETRNIMWWFNWY
jgi:carboxylesterase type B